MAVVEKLLTAEEFAQQVEPRWTELVRGVVVPVSPPSKIHGVICSNIAAAFYDFLRMHDVGRVLICDAGIVTARDPDSVRGADVQYHSHENTPLDMEEKPYWDQSPEVVFEVHSPGVSWKYDYEKVSEYLEVGVKVVWVVDYEKRRVLVFREQTELQVFSGDEEFPIPEVHPDFRVPLIRIFS